MEEKQQQQPAKIPESEEKQEKVIKLLEERLEAHDKNRKAVQEKLTEIQNKLTGQVDNLEERIARELEEKFVSEEDRLQRALNGLRGNSTDSALQEAKRELSTIQSYEIIENRKLIIDLTTLYRLKTEKRSIPDDDSVGLAISGESSSINGPPNTTEKGEIQRDSDKFAEERERLVKLLKERLQAHDCNREAAQDKLHEICERLRTQIDELEDRTNKELEGKFISEDNRLQAALNEVRVNSTASSLQKAKVELLVEQLYELIEDEELKFDLTTLCELRAERQIVPELVEMKKPANVRVVDVNRGIVSVEFTCFNPDEERVLSDDTIVNPVKYKCLLFKKGNEQESKKVYSLYKDEENDSFAFTPDILGPETTYGTRVKMVVGDRESEWSDEVAEFTTPEFKECCVWKECPDYVYYDSKYSMDEENPRVATKINSIDYCTAIGSTYIPLNKVTSWNIRIHKSRRNDGGGIYIGIAQNNVNQNVDCNYNKCGWYFNCCYSKLRSGPPHSYDGKEYGPRKEEGQYVHTGDSVGVLMDTTKGELSFVLNGVNLGVAYGMIPLDEPLVPCVILWNKGDSVELDTSEVKENMDSSIPVPFKITAKSTTWDSITLTWDEVDGTSFYQIEMDGSKSCDTLTTNAFTKRGFLPDIEHSFRVRVVRGSSVSEWSGVVKVRTLKAPKFSECVWKKCPGHVYYDKKYSVDGRNPKVATKVNDNKYCTIIGNTFIPLNKVTSWSIKVLKSRKNNGGSIYIGIAPPDINQNVDCNYNKCGWYLYCYWPTLYSGPPHSYKGKEYGSMKEWYEVGQYVHTGDSVGVVMNTKKGELSFIVDGINLGVAYVGIPLDKPLVPCVILKHHGDSVEFIN